MTDQSPQTREREIPDLVPDHIDVCATCGYRAWRENYPCNRCGQLESVRFVPEVVPAVVTDENERLRDRLTTMNECVRIYLSMRAAGAPARPGWLEEEVAATDALLNARAALEVPDDA